MLQHLQSVLVCAYRDYNVISGVGIWCQVEVRVYDKKSPWGQNGSGSSEHKFCVATVVLGMMTVCDTHTHTFMAIWLLSVTGGFSDDLFL